MNWQTVRDLLIAALVVSATAAIDYFTSALQTHPLGSAALSAVIVAALGILRRAINPTVPVADVPRLSIVSDWDKPTPLQGVPVVAMQSDDDPFLSECAAQIHACTPGNVKQFDPATIIAILVYLFQHTAEIEALLTKAKAFIAGLLARLKLRKAVKAAMLAEGNTAYPSIDAIDGFTGWLGKADPSVIRRVKMIADGRRK